MRSIGFSTGALALGDFRRALGMLVETHTDAVELSALRQNELSLLVQALPTLDFSSYKYVSVHAPSSMSPDFEHLAVDLLEQVADRCWPIIVHPDVIRNPKIWRRLGQFLCVENMDKRKPVGQKVEQLLALFEEVPDASFCFDLGHARQVDPTMTEAFLILRTLKGRLKQVHISDVNSESRHAELTIEAVLAFRRLGGAIPACVPVIIESRVHESQIQREIQLVRQILDDRKKAASDGISATQCVFT